MRAHLRLWLPALVPSWRFFDRVGPAPRLEYSIAASAATTGADWRELRPRPARVGSAAMIAQLFWNPRRNESLFLVSCAERLLDDPTPGRAQLLWQRAADCLRADGVIAAGAAGFLRIRIVEVTGTGRGTASDVVYVSEAVALC